jgi:hypothetical protein
VFSIKIRLSHIRPFARSQIKGKGFSIKRGDPNQIGTAVFFVMSRGINLLGMIVM